MNRGFRGIWIPARVWLDDRLNVTEKVLLAEIDSFASRDQEFFKSNETIAAELSVSVSTIKRAIRSLEEAGYVTRVSFDGRKRAMRSNLDPSDRPIWTDSKLKMTEQTGQNEPADRSKRTKSKTKKVARKSTKKEEVVLPWSGFGDAWSAWKEYRRAEHRFNYKSSNTEQIALKKLQELSNDNEDTAKKIIEQSIANGWKGLFALRAGAGAKTATAADVNQFEQYLRTGRV